MEILGIVLAILSFGASRQDIHLAETSKKTQKNNRPVLAKLAVIF